MLKGGECIEARQMSPQEGSVKVRKRRGRGTGSGLGKTSGQGHKDRRLEAVGAFVRDLKADRCH